MTLGQEQFLSVVGMSHEMLGVCVDEAWLIPTGVDGEQGFSGIDVARALLICDLHTKLGVNYEGIGVVLNLVDQLYGIRGAMAELIEAARASPHRL